jgi:Na+/H+-translocating membrane pyrophosphatase
VSAEWVRAPGGAQTTDTDGVRMMGAFFAGAALSAGAGYAGMMVATDGNVRTTVACTAGTLNDGLRCAPFLSPSPSLSLSLSLSLSRSLSLSVCVCVCVCACV